MKKIRINNDIAIYWSILVDGEKKNLEGRTIEVELSNTRGYSIKPALTIQGNTLAFEFKGTEQTSLGTYTMKATDTTDGAMHTLDIVEAFELVPHSCAEDCECRCVKGIEIKYINLTSDIPSTFTYKTINGESILGEGNIETREPLVLVKHNDLLYGAKYGTLDYEFAKEYFKTHYAPVVGGCSVVRKGNKIVRNLDWYYNNEVEFIVETDTMYGRHASKGFVGTISALTKDIVAQGIDGDMTKVLPFRITDGLNDAGLFASVNVVNHNATRSIADKGTTPAVEERDELCLAMLVRYILDHFDNAQDACEYIRDYVRVYAPVSESNKNEGQIYVADKERSFVLSFEGTQTRIIEDVNVLTNFRIADTTLVDGRYAIDGSNIEDYGSGVERANIALDMLADAGTEDIARALHYTHAYEVLSTWLTEFVGIDGATIHDASLLRATQEKARYKYLTTTREKSDIWQTTHSVIYDLDAMIAEFSTQEINDGYSVVGTLDCSNYHSSIEELEQKVNKKFDEVDKSLREKTEKVRVDIVGTIDNYQFKQGDKVLNFAELNELLQVSPNFIVFVHGSREHRCVEIINEGNARSMTFLAPTIEGTNVKAQSFKITSSNGVAITSIKRTDIVCENKTDADIVREDVKENTAKISELEDEMAHDVENLVLSTPQKMYFNKNQNVIASSESYRIRFVKVEKTGKYRVHATAGENRVYVGICDDIPAIGVSVRNIIPYEQMEINDMFTCEQGTYLAISHPYIWANDLAVLETESVLEYIERVEDATSESIESINKELSDDSKDVAFEMEDVEYTRYSSSWMADKTMEFKDGMILKSIILASNGTESAIVKARVYDENDNIVVSDFELGTIGTNTTEFNVRDRNIELRDGWTIAVSRSAYGDKKIPNRFYNYSNGSWNNIYTYGISVIVEEAGGNRLERIETSLNSAISMKEKPLYLAYSGLGFDNFNVAEHFEVAAHLGFDMLKADIQVTSDGHLVCCHDASFTISESNPNLILRFNSSSENNIAINSITWERCRELVYDWRASYFGYNAKVCDVETYLSICRKRNVTPYLTFRSNYGDDAIYGEDAVLDELKALLIKTGYYQNCIINTYTPSLRVAQKVREKLPYVVINWTCIHDIALTKKIVEDMNALGNARFSLFSLLESVYDASYEAILLANSYGYSVGVAQLQNKEQEAIASKYGIATYCYDKPALHYNQKDYLFRLSLNGGVASLQDCFGQDNVWSANIEISGDTLYISSIKEGAGSAMYVDGLPPIFMNYLPYEISISQGEVIWIDNKLRVRGININEDKDYLIRIRV